MGFYEEISKYYDYIFPVGQQQLSFIKESAGEPSKKILDVACGSGGYTVEFSKMGYKVIGTDLDDKMVEMASQNVKDAGVDAKIIKCDMRQLEEKLDNKYDCIFCIGNSIVHLGSLEEISKVIKQMNNILDNNSKLVIQIINYDRIIKNEVAGLPTIANYDAGLEFEREYVYNKEEGLINFNTTLTVSENGNKTEFKNKIPLYPVMSDDLRSALSNAGFSKIEFFGDFNYSEYTQDSYMLVARAAKI